MLVGLIALLALILIGPHTGGFREQAAFMMSLIDFNQTVLHGMLGFLLFAGAIHIKLDELAQAIASISLLAILGILASTFITGGLTWLVLGGIGLSIPFIHAHAVWRPDLADRSHCRHGHPEIGRSPQAT